MFYSNMGFNMIRIAALLIVLSALMACGGAPFTAADEGDSGSAAADGFGSALPDAALGDGAPSLMPDILVHDDAGPTGDAVAPNGADTMPAVEAATHDAAPDVAVLPDVVTSPPTYCCVSSDGTTTTGGSNVHCGIGAHAACGSSGFGATTYDSASCSTLTVGATCVSWPQSYGSAQSCGSSEPCCYGTVQVCP